MNSSTASFLAGAACTAAAMLLYQSYKTKSSTSEQTTKPADGARAAAETTCFDSVDLDQRMIRKAEGAICKRTSRLIIVVERCTNDHNYSAIIRTAEALGVQNIWIISPQTINVTLELNNDLDESNIDSIAENSTLRRSAGPVVRSATESEKKDRAMHHLYARNATEWLTVRDFEDTKTCIESLREEGYQVWATDLGQEAICMTEDGIRQHLGGETETYDGKLIPNKVAIVFGTEAVGCTAEMLNAADLRVYLPLRGFADSLNLSVAAALVVHQMFVLDPSLEGAMTEDERRELRQAWYAKLASQRLLSSADKRRRAKLTAFLQGCESVDKKIKAGEHVYKEERAKWSQMDAKRAELNAIEEKLAADSKKAVKDLVDNPPSPITDMRRADEHRVCRVGKNTKKASPWQGMPATEKVVVTENATCSFFRERVGKEEEKKD